MTNWAQVAALPLRLLSPQMRNRRLMDECFAAEGTTVVPAIETDTVAGLYAHLGAGQWSSVISHAWLHMFGVPDSMRVVPMAYPAPGPNVGLAVADRSSESPMAKALLVLARRIPVRTALDELVDGHFGQHPYRPA
ncbi:LysR substrate-binding domain-containing protein [Streptomyces sp. H27-C3]|uniref:LysR substrate-binding domain-containing protein n=1 Tax=Streptomyces sp. H27-C3 TaxID=3046305 RepID=UPI0024B8E546|nr:LysR substrate-binding domain-containing protein [Streptomyces sp. H27-C3]MDJ0463713.1 LysR substrate-binding domain-containing protein [Streptomyces sp. H27-C3]